MPDGNVKPTEIALYDIVADPSEQTNRAADEPDRAAALRTQLDTWWTPKR